MSFSTVALAINPFAEKQEEIGKCAVQILNSYQQPHSFIMYDAEDLIINKIVSNIRSISYVLINLQESHESLFISWRPNLYFVFTDTVAKFEKILELFYRTSAWNPRATFFVLYLGDEDVIELIELSWKYYALRTYILDKTLEVRSYYPFKNEKCGESLQPEVLYVCGNRQFETKNLTHMVNVPIKFNKCPFRVEALKIVPYVISTYGDGDKGFEIQILEEIAHYSNISLIFLNHTHKTWGYRDANNYDAMFKDLLDRKTDAIVGMVTTSSIRYLFDKTVPHAFDDNKYFVPAGKQIEHWRHFFMIFDYRVWILLLITINVTSLVLWCGGILSYIPEGYHRFDYCLLQIIAVTVSAIPRLPRALYFRCITFLWIFCSVILSSTYQCKLLTFLVKPAFEDEITSFAQLVESNLILKGHYTDLKLMQYSDPEVYKKVRHRWKNCSLASLNCTIQVIDKRDSALAQSERITKYLIQKHYGDKNIISKIKGLDDKVYSYAVCFYLDLGSPYYERFNTIISRLTENGMIVKWVEYLEPSHSKISADEFVRLNFDHMILAFEILIIGHIVAFCMFIVELCYHRVTYFKSNILLP